MKIQQITLILFTFYFSSIQSQVTLNNEQKEFVRKISQEQIFIHFNSNFLITGERLFYKVYTQNTTTKNLSTLSKIAYIAIVNSKKETVLDQKIKLTNGIGFGDFFISTPLTTGNYKLIGYTQWMKNKNLFFEEDLYIYNAFTNPPKILAHTKEKQPNKNLKTYAKREKVTLPISTIALDSAQGDFSISVKKVNPSLFPEKMTSEQFPIKKNQTNLVISSANKKFSIPEFRGELLSGIVASKNNNNIENLKVILSSIHKNGSTQITNTNTKGEFHFNITTSLEKENLNIQLDVDGVSNYSISLLKKFPVDYSQLQFKEITTSREVNNIIKSKSIHLQIENAYSVIKTDSIQEDTYNFKLYQQTPLTFVLDKYKRFNTMEETVIEVIQSCWIENKNGNYTFYVRDENLVNNKLFKPLIIVDGHIVTDHNELANFHPRKIKTVHVFRKKHIINSKQYHGTINVETFKLSFKPDETKIFKLNTRNISKEKIYFKQSYAKNKDLRIPDYRTQLYWNPTINGKEINFYTSDVTGVFEINIEGFSNTGKPISLKQYFKVE